MQRPARPLLLGLVFSYLCFECLNFLGLWVYQSLSGNGFSPRAVLPTKSRVAIEVLISSDRTSAYTEIDDTLGWSIAPSREAQPLYRSNSQGLRADRDYDFPKPTDRKRIATFGDSFTHGDDVANDETWQHHLEAALDADVLNYGVGGFGLDQAYLRYRHDFGSRQADVVVIGYMSVDIRRNLNTFRPFIHPQTNLPLGKPRFILAPDGASLVLVPNPIRGRGGYRRLLRDTRAELERVGKNDSY